VITSVAHDMYDCSIKIRRQGALCMIQGDELYNISIYLVKLERQRAADIRNDQGTQLAYIYCLLQTTE